MTLLHDGDESLNGGGLLWGFNRSRYLIKPIGGIIFVLPVVYRAVLRRVLVV